MGNQIVIKFLNMQEEESYMQKTLSTIKFAPLMPFYFDFDYNCQIEAIKKLYKYPARPIKKVKNAAINEQSIHSIINLMTLLEKMPGSKQSKNSKLIDLLVMVKKILDQPQSIFASRLPKKIRKDYIMALIRLVRSYHSFDLNQVKIVNLKGLKYFFKF